MEWFPPITEAKQECSLSPALFNITLEILANAIRQKERKKGHTDWKEEIKWFIFRDDKCDSIQNSEDVTKLLELKSEFRKPQGTESTQKNTMY